MKATLVGALLCVGSIAAFSQAQKPAAPMPYGSPVTAAQAEKIMKAALEEASKNGWTMAIAIVDAGGNLVMFERMDNTQIGSIEVALQKAYTANNFKRPTKAFEDVVAGGGVGLRVLSLPGAVALEGGEPIVIQGKIVGAIGVSGMASGQDAQVARAGLAGM